MVERADTWRRGALVVVAALGALAAPAPARAQERLHLESLGDEALHALTLGMPDHWDLDAGGGLEGTLARGAVSPYDRPFSLAAYCGFGRRWSHTDLVQVRSQIAVPVPLAVSGEAGPLRVWDLEGAHRVRAQIGLGGLGREYFEHRMGADLSFEGALWQGGTYGTTFVRRDIGPYPFLDASARTTVTPRYAFLQDGAYIFPVSGEVRHVEVDRPEGVFAFTSARVSTGVGSSYYEFAIPHGTLEWVGFGYEHVDFFPPSGAPRPALGAVRRIDLRFVHLDGGFLRLGYRTRLEGSFYLGGNWLADPTGRSRLATFAGAASGAFRFFRGNEERVTEVALGLGAIHDGTFLADGSALTGRSRLEAFHEGSFLARRVGWSLRGAAEELPNVSAHDSFRGAVAAEWFTAPVAHLEVGMDFTATEQCVSTATAMGPAWCRRFGVFVRGAFKRPWKDEPMRAAEDRYEGHAQEPGVAYPEAR